MNKRKKTQISEKQELRVSKAKKTPKRKTQVIRECDLEKPVEASDSSNTLLKATVAEAVQECKEHSLDNTTMEILGTDLDVSSAEESKKASSERKVHAKGFLPPSQDMLESSEAECMVRNVPCDTAGKAIQNTVAPLELMDLLVTKQEDTGEQGILHSEERVDTNMQNKDRIITVNDSGALPGLDDSHEEAQKPTNTETNISEKQKIKSKKRVSFFLSTSHDKDAKSLEETELSIGSLDHVISNQNEEMSEGPILQTKQGTKNRCDKLVLVIQQSKFDTCDLRPNEISETVFSREVDQQNVTQIPAVEIKATEISSCSLLHMDGKEETVVRGENKLVCMEGCLSSAAEVIPQPDGVVMRSDSSRESPRSEAQGSLLSTGTGSSIGALSSLDTMDQKCSPTKDPPSVDLEYLLDSQLEGNFESSSLEVLPHKPFSLDDPCAAEGAKSIVNVAHPNSARDEMMARICDPSKEEDATDVILGLIKELSNLNRLVMNTHRDLDSFRRLKFWKHRQSGKLLPHSMNTMTNMQCTVKKKKKMSLVNTMASFNICKDFLCSSDVSSAVTSKAVITHDREDV